MLGDECDLQIIRRNLLIKQQMPAGQQLQMELNIVGDKLFFKRLQESGPDVPSLFENCITYVHCKLIWGCVKK
jgi:hypothetical protein